LRQSLKRIVLDVAPRIVFTHSPDDRHPDHYAVAKFVEKVVREINDEAAEVELCFWEPGSGGPMVGFRPDLFVELSEEDVEVKRRALEVYVSQDPNREHLRRAAFASDRAAAWGRIAGIPCAEAFATCGCPRKDPWEGESEAIRQFARGDGPREMWRLRGSVNGSSPGGIVRRGALDEKGKADEPTHRRTVRRSVADRAFGRRALHRLQRPPAAHETDRAPSLVDRDSAR